MHRNVWFAVSTVVTVVAAFALKGIVGDFFTGVACGFLVNIIVGLWFSWAQLSCSTAGYRVKKTVEGTQKIIDQEAGRGRERDRYRYSLGVIIDDLEQTFGREGNFNDKEWPCLVDYDPNTHDFSKDEKGKYKDRWERFRRFVRPVVDDINSSSFIGSYSWIRCFSKDVRQLYALTKLCSHLESVVSELDAAIEPKSLIELNAKDHVVIKKIDHLTDSESKSIERLSKEYRDLFVVWREWLCATGIPCKAS